MRKCYAVICRNFSSVLSRKYQSANTMRKNNHCTTTMRIVILKHNSTCSTSAGSKDVVSTFLQMVIYIEACESGSMFDDLLKTDINVFATTAANPDESSYACYYDDKRETYLGDRYSVSWLEDSDKV